MTKTDFLKGAAEKFQVTYAEASKAYDIIFGELERVFVHQKKIHINGIGTFGVKKKAARNGRNPKTGEMLLIPEKDVPYFKPSPLLKEKLNSVE